MTLPYHTILRATADELASAPRPQKPLIKRLREAGDLLEKVPEAKREKIAKAMRVLDPRLVSLPDLGLVDRETGKLLEPSDMSMSRGRRYDQEPLSEAYPNAPLEIQARLVLGEKTTAVTGGLTAKEAHEYLSDPKFKMGQSPGSSSMHRPNPATWLIRGAGLQAEGVGGGVANFGMLNLRLDSVPVARWIIERWRDPAQRDALIKDRLERGPHGEELRGRFIDRIDEVKDEDLRPSVRDTFAAAGQRMMKAMEADLKKASKQTPLAPTPHWWEPVRCAVLLDRPKMLATEGEEMQHCVATYVPYVRQQRSVIVAFRVRDKAGVVHRSTAEIDRNTLEVRQHRGVGNRAAPPLNERALKVMLTRWRTSKDKRMDRPGRLPTSQEREGNPLPDVSHLAVAMEETPSGELRIVTGKR